MDSRLAAGVALGAAGMWVLQCGRGPGAAAKPPAPGHDLRHTRPLPAPAPAASTPAAEVKDPTIVALLPMKHTSVRVPGKNYRTLKDKPLCCWILSTLQVGAANAFAPAHAYALANIQGCGRRLLLETTEIL